MSKPDVETKEKVVIIGAGLAGLSTAYYLLKQGGGKFDVTLIEQNSSVGGRVHTAYIDGRYIDLGGFMVFTFYHALRELVHELGLSGSLKRFASDTEWYQLEVGGPFVNGKNIEISRLIPLSLFRHMIVPILEGKADFYEPDFSLFNGETTHEFYKHALHGAYQQSEKLANEIFTAYTYSTVSHIPMTLCMAITKQVVTHGMFSRCEHVEGGSSLVAGSLMREIETMGGTVELSKKVHKVESGRVFLETGEQFSGQHIVCSSLPSKSFLETFFKHGSQVSGTYFYTVVAEMEHDTDRDGEPWFVTYCAMPEHIRTPHIASLGQCASFSDLSRKFLIFYIRIPDHDTHVYSEQEIREISERELKRFFPNNTLVRIFASRQWTHAMPIIGIDLLAEIRDKQGKDGFYFAGDYTGIPCMDTAVYSGKKVALSLIKKQNEKL